MIGTGEALERLRAGNRRYRTGVASPDVRPFDARPALEDLQQPFAIVLGCADSRVPVELIFDQGLGDLFVIRVAGNIVTPAVLGSIEFAAAQLGARLVVVLGHSRCGAVEATWEAVRDGTEVTSPNLGSIVEAIRPVVEPLGRTELRHDPPALVRRAIRANVAAAVDQIPAGSAILHDLIRDDELVVVGSEYSLATGEVDFFRAAADLGERDPALVRSKQPGLGE